ncbi:hypothetical protein LOTGIDRAFT_157313 [Lottia gigantea]|uniref:Uncharacterized protein n=1 Tax=Lottia gigantea TaxID=225164 RepID=V4ADR8_LOTGI|nr:hypothetical protein LOTGIDRAFT_157313 [Lottia gigantea]ESP02159.1 hypothetical protein LOTGIDRAFT_157313 [Lottia gigantea]
MVEMPKVLTFVFVLVLLTTFVDYCSFSIGPTFSRSKACGVAIGTAASTNNFLHPVCVEDSDIQYAANTHTNHPVANSPKKLDFVRDLTSDKSGTSGIGASVGHYGSRLSTFCGDGNVNYFLEEFES